MVKASFSQVVIGSNAVRSPFFRWQDGQLSICLARRCNSVAVISRELFRSAGGNAATWNTARYISETGYDTSDPQIGISSDGSNRVIQGRIAEISGNTAERDTARNMSAPVEDAYGPQVSLSATDDNAVAIWARVNDSKTMVQTLSAHEQDDPCFAIMANNDKVFNICL